MASSAQLWFFPTPWIPPSKLFTCTSGNFVLAIVKLFCSSPISSSSLASAFPFHSYTLGGFKMDDSLAGSLSNLCMVYWFHDCALHLTSTQYCMFIEYMPLVCNLDCPSKISVVCKTYEAVVISMASHENLPMQLSYKLLEKVSQEHNRRNFKLHSMTWCENSLCV